MDFYNSQKANQFHNTRLKQIDATITPITNKRIRTIFLLNVLMPQN